MNMRKLEEEVIVNTILLEYNIEKHTKKYTGKYIVFNEGEHYIVDSYSEGIKKGEEIFGEDKGFVVRKLSKTMPVCSSFVSF